MAVQLKARATVRGEVEAVNEKGVKIAGEWWNFSRFHAVPHPYRDELVELTVTEGTNWIEALVVVEDSKGVRVLRQPDAEPTSEQAHGEPQRPTAPSSARETVITRLACLRSAVQLAAGKGDLTSADVLKVAERFEAWVNRDGEGAPDA